MFHRFNERAREAIERAAKRAKDLRHPIVEPEHILASLAEDGPAGETSFHSLLRSFDVSKEAVADSLEAVPGPAQTGPIKDPVFSPEAKHVLELAVDEADKLGHKRIGTSHFLLAFVRDELEGEQGSQTLTSLGLSLADARERVREIATDESAGRADVVPSILFFELDRRAREAEQVLTARVESLAGEIAALRGALTTALARLDRLSGDTVRGEPKGQGCGGSMTEASRRTRTRGESQS
jgi:ATP-dependent Clp protease ATP-binding subunit ClpC